MMIDGKSQTRFWNDDRREKPASVIENKTTDKVGWTDMNDDLALDDVEIFLFIREASQFHPCRDDDNQCFRTGL